MSNLFIFGCSYAYGHGLADCLQGTSLSTPSKLGWAQKVADMSNRNCINLSHPGGSNRQAVHELQNCDITSDDIAIFHWSFYNRAFYLNHDGKTGIKIGTWNLVQDQDTKYRKKKAKIDRNTTNNNSIAQAHYRLATGTHMLHETEILIDYTNLRLKSQNIKAIHFEPIVPMLKRGPSVEKDYWDHKMNPITQFDKKNLMFWQQYLNFKNGYQDLADDGDHPGQKSNDLFADYILEEYPWLKE
ncbi:hypothetical protein OAA64_01435 [bacterium]|nr:hypothetical protein [bacterium]